MNTESLTVIVAGADEEQSKMAAVWLCDYVGSIECLLLSTSTLHQNEPLMSMM